MAPPLLHVIWVISTLISVSYCTPPDLTVSTSCGLVQGLENDGAFSFRGIPYARPPVGELRWQPPVPLRYRDNTCWKGTFRATKFGSSCYQPSEGIKKVLDATGSEDCLFLNVWTPTIKSDAKLPVMVYVHGGSLQMGNGSMKTYSPSEKLSRDTGVVYVSMNYRLHAFGFLALKMLADASSTGTSGNYGLMDVLLVLKWVQNNIGNFGGDSDQVTLFGHSSGGTIIYALLASPLSEGLFHKAWLSSASPILNKTASEAFVDNEVFIKNSGCDDVKCLYSMTSNEVFLSTPWFEYPAWGMINQMDLPTKGVLYGAMIVVDGYVLGEAPMVAWSNGRRIDIPLMIGTTSNEIDISPFPTGLSDWDWVDYQHYVSTKIGTFGEDILRDALKLYKTGDITPEYQLTAMASDIRVNCGNGFLAFTAAESFTSPIYRYVVTADPSKPVHALELPFSSHYAFHMWDVFAFFGVVEDYIKSPSENDLKYQNNLQEQILQFVKNGAPKSLQWTEYPESTALLDETTKIVDSYKPIHCSFWLINGFFEYSFVN